MADFPQFNNNTTHKSSFKTKLMHCDIQGRFINAFIITALYLLFIKMSFKKQSQRTL